jgi:MFS family permease
MGTTPSPSGTLRAVPIVAAGGLFTAAIASAQGVMLPDIGATFGIDVEQTAWFVLCFQYALMICLLPAGRLSDRLGHRGGYLLGFLCFGLGSLGTALAPGWALLLCSRLLQGAGAAMVVAASPALLTASVGPARQGLVLGIVSSALALGTSAGPLLAGLAATTAGWRTLFWGNLWASAAIVVVGALLIPRPPRRPRSTRSGAQHPIWQRQRRLRASSALSSSGLAYMGMHGAAFILSFVMRLGRGMSAALVGRILALQAAGTALCAVLAGALADRLGCRRPSLVGLVLLATGLAGLAWTAGVQAGTAGATALFALVAGAGFGTFVAPNTKLTMSCASVSRRGTASAMMSILRNGGMSVGVWLASKLVNVSSIQIRAWNAHADLAASNGLRLAAGLALLAAILCLLVPALERMRAEPAPSETAWSIASEPEL